MNISRILKELQAEKDRIDQAIAALEAVGEAGPRQVKSKRRKVTRKLSAAGRRRIALAQRKRWADARKKKTAA